MTTLEKELAQYEAQLADPGIYSNAAQLKDATLKFEQVQKELTLQTKRWEELV
ncbi:ABC transporter C-terminal domain-containing protein [Hymenobacter sp. HDW8]|uniref:ABC transporter C-terminal domain-containing protein n=1 Tax=Hymenobacter sp. HDW8 TaxID=2714932 RepID=UPI0039773DB1